MYCVAGTYKDFTSQDTFLVSLRSVYSHKSQVGMQLGLEQIQRSPTRENIQAETSWKKELIQSYKLLLPHEATFIIGSIIKNETNEQIVFVNTDLK